MKFTQIYFAVFVAMVSLMGANGDGGNEVNCDEICASQVAEATRGVNEEKAALEGQLSPLQAALEQAKEASVTAASEVTNLKGQLATMEGAVAEAKAETEAAKAGIAEGEAASAAKIAEIEAELAAAKSRVEEFESARYFINKDLIKSDMKGLLKKYGLVKEEL